MYRTEEANKEILQLVKECLENKKPLIILADKQWIGRNARPSESLFLLEIVKQKLLAAAGVGIELDVLNCGSIRKISNYS